MNPHQNQRQKRTQVKSHLGERTSPVSEGDQPPPADTRNQQEADRQPQYSGGFTVIPPNESLRSQIKTKAQKEEDEFQRWKEAHRTTSVHTNPEKLGGSVSLAEAREKQLRDLRCSKLQKKLRKEEQDKRRKEEEEEELQKMKTIQREKSERLEARKREDDARRKEHHREDHSRKTQSFLERIESRAARPSSNATPTSSRLEEVENKQRKSKSVEELELERKRVNAAFLDKLEGKNTWKEEETQKESTVEEEHPYLAPVDVGQQAATGQEPWTHLKPDSEQRFSGWTEEADPEPDRDWALMKLITNFPDCAKDFLEDILTQCNGDYEDAYTLLICTLS
ncbi:epithelial-stromal interaction protein 1 [Cololabis saira]|uniref:epithelial-stromal interaction protein 1 n=1 Tax=Cololabis saira TaxID=129043 RepID=UPI002AD24C6C|nr:epithelial-stromal interaction protein 1 [Cololabis saira]